MVEEIKEQRLNNFSYLVKWQYENKLNFFLLEHSTFICNIDTNLVLYDFKSLH